MSLSRYSQYERVLIRWVNTNLEENERIREFEDLSNGKVFYLLLKRLSKKRCKNQSQISNFILNDVSKKENYIKNIEQIIDFLEKKKNNNKSKKKIDIDPVEVVNGSRLATIKLVWKIIRKYQVLGKGTLAKTVEWMNQMMLDHQIQPEPRFFDNFTPLFELIKRLYQPISLEEENENYYQKYKKELFSLVNKGRRISANKISLEFARDRMGIPMLLEAEYFGSCSKKSLILYFSYFRNYSNQIPGTKLWIKTKWKKETKKMNLKEREEEKCLMTEKEVIFSKKRIEPLQEKTKEMILDLQKKLKENSRFQKKYESKLKDREKHLVELGERYDYVKVKLNRLTKEKEKKELELQQKIDSLGGEKEGVSEHIDSIKNMYKDTIKEYQKKNEILKLEIKMLEEEIKGIADATNKTIELLENDVQKLEKDLEKQKRDLKKQKTIEQLTRKEMRTKENKHMKAIQDIIQQNKSIRLSLQKKHENRYLKLVALFIGSLGIGIGVFFLLLFYSPMLIIDDIQVVPPSQEYSVCLYAVFSVLLIISFGRRKIGEFKKTNSILLKYLLISFLAFLFLYIIILRVTEIFVGRNGGYSTLLLSTILFSLVYLFWIFNDFQQFINDQRSLLSVAFSSTIFILALDFALWIVYFVLQRTFKYQYYLDHF